MAWDRLWRSRFLLAEYGWSAEVIQPGDEGAHFDRYTNKLPTRDVPDVERVSFINIS